MIRSYSQMHFHILVFESKGFQTTSYVLQTWIQKSLRLNFEVFLMCDSDVLLVVWFSFEEIYVIQLRCVTLRSPTHSESCCLTFSLLETTSLKRPALVCCLERVKVWELVLMWTNPIITKSCSMSKHHHCAGICMTFLWYDVRLKPVRL